MVEVVEDGHVGEPHGQLALLVQDRGVGGGRRRGDPVHAVEAQADGVQPVEDLLGRGIGADP